MIGIFKLNESSGSFELISSEDFSSPATFNMSPGGNSLTKKFFIRNDDATKFYTGLVLKPTTELGTAITGTAVKVKLLSGDKSPSELRWAAVAFNGSLSDTDPTSSSTLQSPLDGGAVDTRLPELGTSDAGDTRYYPFWIRIEVAKGAPIGTLSLGLRLTFTEGLVND